LGYDARRLFAEIDRHSPRLVGESNSQDIANVAWSFATLGYQAPTLFAEIDRKASFLQEATVQEVCNTCYAIAVLGLAKEYESTLKKLWDWVV